MRSWEPVPYTQCADVHQTERFTCVETLSGYLMFQPESGGIVEYLSSNVGGERLALAVLDALERSRFIWPPDEPDFFKADRYAQCYRHWQKDFMQRYQYKSKSEAYATMKWCRVERSEDRISIQPHEREKPECFRKLPKDQAVIISATTDSTALGAALQLALDRCR
jgi:hypothetical protein